MPAEMPLERLTEPDEVEVEQVIPVDTSTNRAALADAPRTPGGSKSDAILVADNVRRTFGGLTAVDVEHVEIQRGVITALIGPNGAGKTTFFNLLTGFDAPDDGAVVVQRPQPQGRAGVPRGAPRHGADLPAHQGPVPADRRGEHAHRRHGTEGRDPAARDVPVHVAVPGGRHHRAGGLPARALPARCQAGGLRRLALRRAAQAARDGSRPDGRARDGDAGRADGRREPRPEAVAPRAREVAAGRGAHGALRGARHGHGARHLRLGDRDGAGQDHRGGTTRLRDERPAGHRRLPGLAPRPGPEHHGGDRARRGAGRDHRHPRARPGRR